MKCDSFLCSGVFLLGMVAFSADVKAGPRDGDSVTAVSAEVVDRARPRDGMQIHDIREDLGDVNRIRVGSPHRRVASEAEDAPTHIMRLEPIWASGSGWTISGNEIQVAAGSDFVLELFIGDWDPSLNGTLIKSFHATLDSSGYTSGLAGELTLPNMTCPGTSCPDFGYWNSSSFQCGFRLPGWNSANRCTSTHSGPTSSSARCGLCKTSRAVWI